MDSKGVGQTNRAAWNEALAYHQKARGLALREGFQDPVFTVFTQHDDQVLLTHLAKIDLKGKTIGQLQCNNGRELISLLRLGAAAAVGFDISDAAVGEARELAAIARAAVEFIRTDILDIGHEHDGRFDFIYVSVGSLQWFRSLESYFAVVSRLLKAGGRLLIFEMHPFAFLFEQADLTKGEIKLDDLISYFEPGPYSYPHGLDYVGGSRYEAKPCRWFMHQLSEIVNALIRNGLVIEEMREYNLDITNTIDISHLRKFPLSYILNARKN